MATKPMSAAYGGAVGVLLGGVLGAVLGGKKKRVTYAAYGALGGAIGGAGVGYVMGTEEKKKGGTSNVQPTSTQLPTGGVNDPGDDDPDVNDPVDPSEWNDPGGTGQGQGSTGGNGGDPDPDPYSVMDAVVKRPGLRAVTMNGGSTGARNARRR